MSGVNLHMSSDALVSVGVLVSGLIINWTDLYIIDPIIGIVIAVVILISTWGLLRDSLRLSMDGVPMGINTAEIEGVIKSADSRVKDVHHLHIWALSTTENALTAHLVIESGDGLDEIKHNVRDALREHGIGHSTLELELPGEKERESCSDCG